MHEKINLFSTEWITSVTMALLGYMVELLKQKQWVSNSATTDV
jgi:hypothetical protein